MQVPEHLITREIGIDMGHRVTFHGSKCRNIHGHRYTIQATCAGPLFVAGEQQGMVMDFGFLKDLMMEYIDAPCDHGMCLWVDDPFLRTFITDELVWMQLTSPLGRARSHPLPAGNGTDTKLYVVPFVPTAENLAAHWYLLLQSPVEKRSDGHARLQKIKVWETPNCSAEFPVMGG